ncbi:MAG: glycosyl hydrolase family 28-related protein [Bradyrhizobium sp.]
MSGSILQSGPITFGHVPMWLANGTLMDGGRADAGALTQVGITNDGGQAFGINSGPITQPYVGFGITVSSNGNVQISAGGFNGGANANLEYIINGITFSLINTLSTVVPIESIATLRSLAQLVPAPTYNVKGYYASADGGGGLFDWVPSDTTSADDGGSIIIDAVGNRFYRQIAGQVTWKQFGARGDGLTDDTARIQAAWNYSAASGGTKAYGPPGRYLTTAPLVLPSKATITGASSYSAVFTDGWEQETTIVYNGNVAALTVTDPLWGGVSIEKVGFLGDYLTYPAAIGLFLDDSVRTIYNVCGLLMRDVMFKWFATGIWIGNKYQTVWAYNVNVDSCSQIGALVQSSDNYFHELTCGNSGEGTHTAFAAISQLFLGNVTPQVGPSGVNRFIGGQFFSANHTIIIQNSNTNKFFGCDIQNAQTEGVLVGDGTFLVAGNAFFGCLFSGNNIAGGAGNVSGTAFCDAQVLNAAAGTRFIGCTFADISGMTTKVAGAVSIGQLALGTVIMGCIFNIDNMHSPSGTAAPFPLQLSAGFLTDGITVEGNQYTTGYSGPGLVSQNWGAMEMQNQYTANGTISLTPRTAVLNGGYSPIFMTLPNPQWIGRKIDIMLTSGIGTAVSAQTANGFNASRSTITFNAAFATISLIALTPTIWGIASSTNVTLT